MQLHVHYAFPIPKQEGDRMECLQMTISKYYQLNQTDTASLRQLDPQGIQQGFRIRFYNDSILLTSAQGNMNSAPQHPQVVMQYN